MTTKPTLAQRLRYAFDNTLSRGPAALILWLVFATAALIAAAIVLDLIAGRPTITSSSWPIRTRGRRNARMP